MKSLSLVAVSVCFLSLGCHTVGHKSTLKSDAPQAVAVPHQVARFTPWLDVLHKSIDNVTLEQAGLNLLEGSNRVAAFNIQALGMLYADQDPMFETFRIQFKRLEDSIGQFDKWK